MAQSSVDHESVLASSSEPEYITQTFRITRQEALDKAGDLVHTLMCIDVEQSALRSRMKDWADVHTFHVLPRGMKSRVIRHFKAMLDEDMTETSWEERVPGPKKEILRSDLAKPWLDKLKDVISYLPDSAKQQLLEGELIILALTNILELHDVLQQQQIQHETKQADLVEANFAKFQDVADQVNRLEKAVSRRPSGYRGWSSHSVSDIRVQKLKAVYAKLQQDNIAIPQELDQLASCICPPDKLTEILNRE
ncbi:uncharacterized protein FIESC28_04963 [Fusarium coffeatum]|uniref:Uncharacterized protein n=1 Tax=Fusarium coffeatum TaxID=231269 RepID=A0A366RY71_9HYPO|nr:uncharacterized protein FIESC28_04963 [Fusarium coffeatum]RBR21426.1 hypothetical protein FIESC28_04963 [Fusarium coffeatum]